MARINLLPWREERRAQQKKEYLTLLGLCALGAVGVLVVIHMHFKERIAFQESRNAYVQSEIKQLDEQIKAIKSLEKERAQLLARMKAIETLQTSRPVMVHVFDELVKTLPDGVRLNRIQQTGETLTINGFAQSNGSVSNYMRNIERSEWFSEPKLNVIEADRDDGDQRNSFTLVVTQRNPEAEQDEEDM